MSWVDGATLNAFVCNHLHQPATLESLFKLWVKLAQWLRNANLAHADLQHGNVLLVADGKGALNLKLIDYDGMFVPSLAGTTSGECGHPNYQHPLRIKYGVYNAEVDRFPHLVIGCALRALIVNGKNLWSRYDNGDNLLFKQSDFESPQDSRLLRELWQSRDGLTRCLAGQLIRASSLPVGQEPLFADVVGAKFSNREELEVRSILDRPQTLPKTTRTVFDPENKRWDSDESILFGASLPPLSTVEQAKASSYASMKRTGKMQKSINSKLISLICLSTLGAMMVVMTMIYVVQMKSLGQMSLIVLDTPGEGPDTEKKSSIDFQDFSDSRDDQGTATLEPVSFVFLDDLQEIAFEVGDPELPMLGKHGTTNNQIDSGHECPRLNKESVAHSLFFHPKEDGFSWVKYQLNGSCKTFKTTVYNESDKNLTFEILGDGNRLWLSKESHQASSEEIEVSMDDVQVLELRTHCHGSFYSVRGWWIEPRLSVVAGKESSLRESAKPVSSGSSKVPPVAIPTPPKPTISKPESLTPNEYLSRGIASYAKKEYPKAIGDLEKAHLGDVKNDHIANTLARFLATVEDLRFRDAKRAIELAQFVCKRTEEKNASYLDTLGAAYAASQDFEKAVRWQRLALQLAPNFKRDYESRLNRYLCGHSMPDSSRPVTVLIQTGVGGHAWHYSLKHGGSNWMKPRTDDLWQTGKCAFGTKSSQYQKIVNTEWNSSDIYIRTQVQIPELSGRLILLDCKYDDDAQIYVNGKLLETLRYHGDLTSYVLSPEKSDYFETGLNTIAAHCSQSGISSPQNPQVLSLGLRIE